MSFERESKLSSESDTAWTPINFKDIQVGKQIGGGGFAIVYKGKYNGQRVALKTMFDPRVDDKTVREYMEELHILSSLEHPHIVELYGACVQPPNLCMVMRLCEQSLHSVIHVNKPIPSEKELMRIAMETSSALEYLHSRTPAIIHRDIKSQNVLLTSDLQVKLCDFGLVSTENTTAGTPAYMAPELLRNAPFSKKVDIYAFGMLLWEMFQQAVPFAGWEVIDIRDFVLRGDRLNLPRSGCHKACIQLIDRCWDEDPNVRPEFSKITKALTRMHSVTKETSFTCEMQSNAGDSFDMLSNKYGKK